MCGNYFKLSCKYIVLELRCRYTFSTSPMPVYKQKSDVPPALKNGRVMPITGRTDVHIPIFITAWVKIIAKIHTQISFPLSFLESRATCRHLKQMPPSSRITAMQPKKPNSSPMLTKIKSLKP